MYRIVLEGTDNTRDLGGYMTTYNKAVKRNLLFRSDRFDKITNEDQKKLIDLGIKRVIDFRSQSEKEKSPNNLPNEIDIIEIEINSDKKVSEDLNTLLKEDTKENNDKIKDFLIEANRNFIVELADNFKIFLKFIINNKKPTCFHCSAGKDRTGFATFLIYTILGVPRDIILDDYLKSNNYISETIKTTKIKVADILDVPHEKADRLLPLLYVDLSYINSAIEEAEKRYGTIENFIIKKIGITPNLQQKFRDYMLE